MPFVAGNFSVLQMVHKGKSSRSCSCKGRGKAERSILRGGAGGAGTGAGGGGRKGGMDYQKDFWEEFDIIATASFIVRNGFQRVALQVENIAFWRLLIHA